ncbi:sugar phosphate nucleotidyltransferase [Alphaproteobacteria bacterium US3C007]|nr:sugar phosphate nucleotidyltransferase [Alphaproteobacteria bacterium US3C007]
MKTIILAGGNGTRLYPLTATTNKHFLQVYNKPMIYYSMSLSLLAGSRDILLICRECDLDNFQKLFGDGSHLGIRVKYSVQKKPNGLPEALIIGKDYLDGDECQLILGDNILYGNNLHEILTPPERDACKILCYPTYDPGSFGIISFDANEKPINITEKPVGLNFGYAVPGVYYFPGDACEIASTLNKSSRGELEIADLLTHYLKKERLQCSKLGRGIAWMDAGTPQGILNASNFIQTLETNQNMMIGCLEELAFRKNFITRRELEKLILSMPSGEYQNYLKRIKDHETY